MPYFSGEERSVYKVQRAELHCNLGTGTSFLYCFSSYSLNNFGAFVILSLLLSFLVTETKVTQKVFGLCYRYLYT